MLKSAKKLKKTATVKKTQKNRKMLVWERSTFTVSLNT